MSRLSNRSTNACRQLTIAVNVDKSAVRQLHVLPTECHITGLAGLQWIVNIHNAICMR